MSIILEVQRNMIQVLPFHYIEDSVMPLSEISISKRYIPKK